jgi:hypothetical protein
MTSVLLTDHSNILLGNRVWDPLLNETVDTDEPHISVNKPLFVNFYANGQYTDALSVNGSANVTLDMTVDGGLTVQNSISASNVSASGTVTGMCFESVSDINMKEYIKPLDDNITLDNVSLYSYKLKGKSSTTYGVMAQDLVSNDFFSHMVSYNETNKHYTVDYTQFIPVLIKEVQGLKKKLKICTLITSVSLVSLLLSLKR